PVLGYGISLHRGDLTYGNIGASGRLDFTVIGPAVNQAARIQEMCKDLGVPILLSAAFADSFAGKLHSFGEHQLRGVEAKQELFTLPPDNAVETAAE
ncbi:MAG: adenylate/guanylate cyclase domain-containing protein, partial [Geminicoccaceae bacterium]